MKGDLTRLCAKGIELRNKRRALEKEVEKIQKQESDLKKLLLEKFTKDELREVKTTKGTARLVPKDVPQAKDWDQVWKYVAKEQAWDLLQKRLHEGACKERREQGVKIPGVDWFHLEVLKFGDAE